MKTGIRWAGPPLVTAMLGLPLSACQGKAVWPDDAALEVSAVDSWPQCRLVGPANSTPGFYGTDLGWGFVHPQKQPWEMPEATQVSLFFGDSLDASETVCAYPPLQSDDALGSLPLQYPSSFKAGNPQVSSAPANCDLLTFAGADSGAESGVGGWKAIHLYDNADRSEGSLVDTGPSRTPAAGFSDGKRAYVFYLRGEPQRCMAAEDCPGAMLCSNDWPGAAELGVCDPPAPVKLDDDSPPICRMDTPGACGVRRSCSAIEHGYCVAPDALAIGGPDGDGDAVSPAWFLEDPRRALAQRVRIASSHWAVDGDPLGDSAAQPDYLQGHVFVTNKFINPVVRTVAFFDPEDPSKNDYRPGTHTLLMWGRSSFSPDPGWQALPHLLHQPLEGLTDADGTIRWRPRFFAGYRKDGRPRWADDEQDARPVYGGGNEDVVVTRSGDAMEFDWARPEFDRVGHMSVSWIDAIARWVMLYGGDLPKWFFFDPATNMETKPVHGQPEPGAIHMRHARHPWGASTAHPRNRPGAWSQPQAVLSPERMAPYLGCESPNDVSSGCTPDDDPHRPLQFLLVLEEYDSVEPSQYQEVTDACLDSSATANPAYALSGDRRGVLYGTNIIDAWTTDVSAELTDLEPGQRAVELYWNVSAWNPYQVALVKTQLRVTATDAP